MTRALVPALQALICQIEVLTDQITEQLHAHADAHIFRSLPRAQALRAGRLRAEIGDARCRFSTPEALASLAGVTPSTRQARAWVYVIWRCWQDGVAYDPSRHGGFQRRAVSVSAARRPRVQ